jgi:hypothetical protein
MPSNGFLSAFAGKTVDAGDHESLLTSQPGEISRWQRYRDKPAIKLRNRRENNSAAHNLGITTPRPLIGLLNLARIAMLPAAASQAKGTE